MNIEEIMKPYFDKKEEIERKTEINNKHIEEKNLVSLRLERLRDNKDREIEEYVQNAVADRPDFYAGYGAMIRKDLEQAYSAREQELENQIKELDEKMDANYKELSRYHRIDVRELTDVKHGLRKELIAAKKELEIKLQETNLRFDAVMYKLSTFKYEYDENHNVLNGNQYRELFELSNSLIEQKYNLQRDLKQVEDYLKITELTEEEVKTVMMSMTDWEKEEYDRRKASLEKINVFEETLKVQEQTEPIEVEEEIKQIEEIQTVEEEKIETSTVDYEQEIFESAQEAIEEQSLYDFYARGTAAEQEQEENYSKFIDEITDDVLMCVKKLRTVEVQDGKVIQSKSGRDYTVEGNLLEEIELPNGLYLNRHDVERAARNYKRQSKGRTFIVKGVDLAYNVTRKSVKKVKEVLRNCSLRELLNEKKISIFDVKRVYGKEEAEKYSVDARNTALKTEDYVKVQDVLEAFKELFIEKTPTWLERLTSKFRRPELEDLDQVPYEDYEEIEEVQDAGYEQIEDEMSWNAEEPEYEVVSARTK